MIQEQVWLLLKSKLQSVHLLRPLRALLSSSDLSSDSLWSLNVSNKLECYFFVLLIWLFVGMSLKKKPSKKPGCLPKGEKALARSIIAIIVIDVAVVTALGILGLTYPITRKYYFHRKFRSWRLTVDSSAACQWHHVGNFFGASHASGSSIWVH